MFKCAKYIVPAILSLLLLYCEKNPTDPETEVLTREDTVAQIKDVLAAPEVCGSCHSRHYQEWKTSMHAYAMKDPVFVALHEIGLQKSNNELDQFCVKCHSPLGTLLAETQPGFQTDQLSSLAAHGIHCDVCHTMNPAKIIAGESIQSFDLSGSRHGPIEDPQKNSFHTSEYNSAYNNSAICAPCHDVRSADGSIFLETTSTEWNNSPYSAMGVECQDCHMPEYNGSAVSGAPQRTLHSHYFVGVDYPLTDFPGKEQTKEMVGQLLENALTLNVEAADVVSANDNFNVVVDIKNDKTGHDIPSGNIFDRQMWIEIVIKDAISGEIYLSSGLLDDNGDLKNSNSTLVQNNKVIADTLLTLFSGTAYNSNHQETDFFWEANYFDKQTIGAFKSYIATYSFKAPAATQKLHLSVRLRFRIFPPYLLREIGLSELLQELIIFDMAVFEKEIIVKH